MTDLRPLLARLEEATGSSWELNKAIGVALDGLPEDGSPVPNYSGSIDASLALVEKKLPGWSKQINETTTFHFVEMWNPKSMEPDRERTGQGATLPLAILICLLRALISNQTDAKGGGG